MAVSVSFAVGGIAPGDDATTLHLGQVQPTVFFVREGDTLLQVAMVEVSNTGIAVEADLAVTVEAKEHETQLGTIPTGASRHEVHVPDISEPTTAELILKTRGVEQDRRSVSWKPQRHWEVYHTPITHHDWGYTQTPDDVLKTYCAFYDDILRFCDQTADWPEDCRFHYTAEEAWSLLHYVRVSPPENVARIAQYVSEGRIEVTALLGNEISGMCGHEELVRLLYPSFALKRELGGSIRSAGITDVPGLSWGLPTVLADAGVKYFFAGMPTYFNWGGLDVPEFWDEQAVLRQERPDAFWWEGPDGGRVLAYYWGGYGCWLPDTYDEAVESLTRILGDLEEKTCPFTVIRLGGHGCDDNTPANLCTSRIAREWNSRWAYPRLVVATHGMFFEALQRQCRDLRTFRGELPHTDYAVGATCSAKETGINRLTRDRLPSAEKLRTISSLVEGAPAPKARIADAYENLLMYDEHTWGMARPAGPIQDWDFRRKALCAYSAAGMTEWLQWAGLERIARRIQRTTDDPYLVVFNPLARKRTDLVQATPLGWRPEIPQYILEGHFDLVDVDTGTQVPHQLRWIDRADEPIPHAAQRLALAGVTTHSGPRHRSDQSYELLDVVLVAKDVPSLGYRTYRVIERKDRPEPTSGLVVGERALENRFFRVTLDPKTGGLESVFDKHLGREIVDEEAPHALNEPVVRWTKDYRQEGPFDVRIAKGADGPVYASLVVSSRLPGCPRITQEIILYEDLKRIDLNNRVLKDSTSHMELYFAFPFRMGDPRFRFEASHSVMRPFEDQFPASNTNYYSVQHWADVSDGQVSITFAPIEAHLLMFGGMWPLRVSQAHHGVTNPRFAEPFISRDQVTRGHMYSLAMVSGFRTNFQATQQGDVLFRYSVTTHDGEWPEGHPAHFGWAIGNPLIPFGTTSLYKGPLPMTRSFCEIDQPNVILTTFKEAENNSDLILRLVETEGVPTEVVVTLPGMSIARAYRTNTVEENQQELAPAGHQIRVRVKSFGIATIRVARADSPG